MFLNIKRDMPKNYKFAGVYIVLVILIYSILGLVFFERNNRHKLMPTIPTSSNIVVVAIDEKSLEKYGNWPWQRDTIAESIQLILDYNPEVLGVDILFQKNGYNSEKLNKVLQDPKVVVAEQISLTNDSLITSSENLGGRTGYINFPVDSDGVVRQAVTKNNNNISLSRKVYGNDPVPDTFLLNPNSNLSQTISLTDLSDKPDLGKFLSGKKVLLGSTVLALGDAHTLPKYGSVPGIFIHAIALNQMLIGNYPVSPKFNNLEEFTVIIALALVLAYKDIFTKYNNFILCIILCIIFVGITIWLNTSPLFSLEFLVSNIFSLTFSSIILYTLENYRERNKLQKTLGLYVPDKVLQMIYKNPNIINLGGELKNITLLFTDIRNFTKMTEKFGKTTEFGIFLNKILDLQTVIIQKNEGVIDKFIGDAVMAFWGAPVSTNQDAFLAIQSACQITLGLQKFNLENNSDLKIGIGVSSGQAIVGNFGSSKRFNYTAIGDSVNTTARLESLNKIYGTEILIGKPAIDALSEEQKRHFKFIEIDTVCPKGKDNSVVLYQVLAFKTSLNMDWVNLHTNISFEEDYKMALNLYYKGEFIKAKTIFDSINFSVAKLLSERCTFLLSQSEEFRKEWNGIWIHGKK